MTKPTTIAQAARNVEEAIRCAERLRSLGCATHAADSVTNVARTDPARAARMAARYGCTDEAAAAAVVATFRANTGRSPR